MNRLFSELHASKTVVKIVKVTFHLPAFSKRAQSQNTLSCAPRIILFLSFEDVLLSQYRGVPPVPANLHQRRLFVRKGHLSLLVEADVL